MSRLGPKHSYTQGSSGPPLLFLPPAMMHTPPVPLSAKSERLIFPRYMAYDLTFVLYRYGSLVVFVSLLWNNQQLFSNQMRRPARMA